MQFNLNDESAPESGNVPITIKTPGFTKSLYLWEYPWCDFVSLTVSKHHPLKIKITL
jgi:hypothetical protein